MADDNEAMWLAGANQLNQSIAQIGSVADSNHARKWSEKMYNRQMADIRANWAFQNSYDAPVMQMARLRAAGLNPAMMMKGGAELSLSGSNMQQASAPSPSFAPYAPAGQFDVAAITQAKLADAEIEKLRADAAEASSRIPVHEQEAANLGKQLEYTDQLIKESEGKIDLMKNQAYAAIVDASANFQNTLSEIQLRLKQGRLTQKEIDSYDERLQSDLAEASARINNLKSDAAYKREMVKQIKEDIRQGKIEFASEWGTSDREIEMRVNRMLDEADVKAGIMSRELARSSKDSYRNWKHFAEIWNDLLGPILSGGADVSDAVSRQRVAGRTAKKVLR